MPRRVPPGLRAEHAKLKVQIDRFLEDPATLPDVERLRAYWRGAEVEVPEKRRT